MAHVKEVKYQCRLRLGILEAKKLKYYYQVQGKTFIVTGGASGMGAIHVKHYLEQGAKGVAIVDISVQQGKELADILSKIYPDKVVFVKCDISKEEEIEKAFAEIVAKFKQVDVIINNAGVMVDTPKVWRLACNVNWQGVVSFTLKGIKHMSKEEGGAGGVIVNIASTAAITKGPYLPIYSGSKSAVLHFCQCLAMDPFYTNTGIRILCMCFGPTDTPLLHDITSRLLDSRMGEIVENLIQRDLGSQKAESAVAAVDYIVKNAANGTIWLSTNNKPAKDITPIVDAAFASFEKVMTENAK